MPAGDTWTLGNSAHVRAQKTSSHSYNWPGFEPAIPLSANIVYVRHRVFVDAVCVYVDTGARIYLCVCRWAGSCSRLAQTPFTTHFLPRPAHPSLPSSRHIHTLTITLPLTHKFSLAPTLTFPTLTDFLGELELRFARLSLSLSSGNDFYLWLHAYLDFFFLSCTFYLSANPSAHERIHLFGWGGMILWVIYTFHFMWERERGGMGGGLGK